MGFSSRFFFSRDIKSACTTVQVLHDDYQHWSKTDSPLPKVVEEGESRVLCLVLETPKGRLAASARGNGQTLAIPMHKECKKRAFILMDCKVEIPYLTTTILFLTHPL